MGSMPITAATKHEKVLRFESQNRMTCYPDQQPLRAPGGCWPFVILYRIFFSSLVHMSKDFKLPDLGEGVDVGRIASG